MRDKKKNKNENDVSFLYGSNSSYIESLFSKYKKNNSSVDESWQDFFSSMPEEDNSSLDQPIWPKLEYQSYSNIKEIETLKSEIENKLNGIGKEVKPSLSSSQIRTATIDSIRALMMIRAYRMRGHLIADLDPLNIQEKSNHPELRPETYGFDNKNRDRKIFIDFVLGLEFATINEMLVILKRTYCSTIGVEFSHIADPEQKSWIQERIEGVNKEITFTNEGKKAILNKLIEAEGFEKFLSIKYTGTKRFGLDGGESAIPALEQIIKRGGNLGVEEIVIGMPHRGRLNVLANVMKKSLKAIFHEFQGGGSNPKEVEGTGDVKYHLGSSSDRIFDENNVHLSLAANPSHLEIVNPVVLGKVRAKQDRMGDKLRNKIMPLLIHGDAAFAGQGVVAECFGLSGLKGHKTGGSIHLIINNQIGFTTSPRYARSSPYPSDVAKMVDAPIFHVNGDDPEAVVYVAKVATEFRQKFNIPVVIDMICYRRFGHNEGDEPSFTQPLMYKNIKHHPKVTEIYSKKLISEGVINEEFFEIKRKEFRELLSNEFDLSTQYEPDKADWLDGAWSGLGLAGEGERRGNTGVEIKTLNKIGEELTKLPENFNIHPTLKRIMNARIKSLNEGSGIDWATAESLAFGSLLNEGFSVRLSGQDSERGTFSHRHSVLIDQENENRYIPLNNISKNKAQFEVINSMLSEEAVLGFEYGYSSARPKVLTMWEAQFGDFANGAQVIIDQFIASGEAKWLRMCGLVLLLPHGYEGQGPEHSSARLERFLQLAAEDNIQVANCTTPCNYFHILRRQIHRNFRKPLILMTPKSFLRNKNVVSNISDFATDKSFYRILWDQDHNNLLPENKIKKLVLCSGKVYFDLYEARKNKPSNDIYLMRIEQLYPFPMKALIKQLEKFKNAQIIWCQEEPQNMGAWAFIAPNIELALEHIKFKQKKLIYVGRSAAASPATGLMSDHKKQIDKFINIIFSNK
jgi:2-oxoglutarate dehydrogenase E1 component